MYWQADHETCPCSLKTSKNNSTYGFKTLFWKVTLHTRKVMINSTGLSSYDYHVFKKQQIISPMNLYTLILSHKVFYGIRGLKPAHCNEPIASCYNEVFLECYVNYFGAITNRLNIALYRKYDFRGGGGGGCWGPMRE